MPTFIGIEDYADGINFTRYFMWRQIKASKQELHKWLLEFKVIHEKSRMRWRRDNAQWIEETGKKDLLMKDHFTKTTKVNVNGLCISYIPNSELCKVPDMLRDFYKKKGFKEINYSEISCSD